MGALPYTRDYGYDHEVTEEEKKQRERCESGDHESIQIVWKDGRETEIQFCPACKRKWDRNGTEVD